MKGAAHHASRLESINGSPRRPGLATIIERTNISRAAASVLFPLAVQTSERGVCWYTLHRLARVCKASEDTCRRGIVEASEVPGLLWYVMPERGAGPILSFTGASGEAPPLDAWGIILPLAANDKAGCARFVAEHIASTRGRFSIRGAGIEAFLAKHLPSANDAAATAPDNRRTASGE